MLYRLCCIVNQHKIYRWLAYSTFICSYSFSSREAKNWTLEIWWTRVKYNFEVGEETAAWIASGLWFTDEWIGYWIEAFNLFSELNKYSGNQTILESGIRFWRSYFIVKFRTWIKYTKLVLCVVRQVLAIKPANASRVVELSQRD